MDPAALTFLGTALAAAVAGVTFVYGKVVDSRQKQSEQYQQLVSWLVKANPATGTTEKGTDEQWAAAFELRHFPRYFSISYKLLAYLHRAWSTHPDAGSWARLLDEMQVTMQYIEIEEGLWYVRLRRSATRLLGANNPLRDEVWDAMRLAGKSGANSNH